MGEPPETQRRIDPRWFQIGALTGLLGWGLAGLRFDLVPARAGLILFSTLAVQYACTRIWRLPAFDPRSALISGLSLCLLLRTGSGWLAVLAAAAAIGSKFLARWKGKHLFNPTNFGLVVMMLVTGEVWVSPGQWGSTAFFGFLIACLGLLVVTRAARSDVTLAFLAAYGSLLLARSLWLGEPLAIPLHRLQSGALLLFAFFMISDPKTTPDSRAGRLLFGVAVALGAAFVQFRLHRPNGLLWSLFFVSLVTPLADRLLPGRRYDWGGGSRPGSPLSKGVLDATPLPFPSPSARALRLATPRAGFLRLLRGQGGREAL
jgi:Na+-transporting NADH:ubiquinone oxidoreductase subunit NqrB